MKPSAMPFLKCINCKEALELVCHETIPSPCNEEYEIISGKLICSNCLKTFPITKGIPRFVDHELSAAVDIGTGYRFGLAWKEFPHLKANHFQQFFDWINPVNPSFLHNKVVLEGGCGKGRHSLVAKEAGAKLVFGVDIGEAVDIAYENVGSKEGIHIVQADICSLPFSKSFDFAFCVGVLHHMKSPFLGFSSLVNVLKPEGSLSIWVYGEENNWWLISIINPIRIMITSRLAPALLRFISFWAALLVYLLSKLIYSPWQSLQNKLGKKIIPTLFYQDYLSYLAHFDFEEFHHIVYDHLTAPVAFYINKEEIQDWFRRCNLPDPNIRWHNRNSWSGFVSLSASQNPTIKSIGKPT